MVNLEGAEIAKRLREILGEVEELPELRLNKLYDFASILIAIGEVKGVPTLVVIGRDLFLLPERLRSWLLCKAGSYGGTPETEKLCNAVTKIFEDLIKTLEKVAECIERNEVLEDKDFSEALKMVQDTVDALPLPRE